MNQPVNKKHNMNQPVNNTLQLIQHRRGRSLEIRKKGDDTVPTLTPVSLMCYAVSFNEVMLLGKLTRMYPYEVNKLSDNGISPLHLAAMSGNINTIKLLLVCNARINVLDAYGKTPLEYAVYAGQFDAAKFLIRYGSDLTKVKDGILV